MKKYFVIILVLVVVGYLFGCGKKQEAANEIPQALTIEQLSTLTSDKTMPAPVTEVTPSAPAAAAEQLQPLPPAGPYTPSAKEIQTALKNAGYYAASIDGKIGPQTKKAIEEFQKANALEADGKVGQKTWAVLSRYLNLTPSTPTN
jgi:peptidoglycan hydrolase-like protein with peptidoglycan-binding domain